MFSCTLYDTLRNKYFDEIINKYNFFNDLDVKSKILFLFNNIDPFICKSAISCCFYIFWDYEHDRHNHVISKVLTNYLIIYLF